MGLFFPFNYFTSKGQPWLLLQRKCRKRGRRNLLVIRVIDTKNSLATGGSQKVLTIESEGSLRVCTLCPTSVMDPPRPPNTCSQSDSVKFSFTISRSSRFS